MAVQLNEVLEVFARHINWHGEEGDRRIVAEFLGRDADEPGTFDARAKDENADNDNDSDMTPDAHNRVDKPTPAKTAGTTGATTTRK